MLAESLELHNFRAWLFKSNFPCYWWIPSTSWNSWENA